ncbi:MAG TPA: COX15/CtaA family protein [Acidimicrobiales bacterium]|nr:COX15/CtaA family protein [Acidimicrobiales bacterium]
MSPPAYRRATLAALVLLTTIVVTGAAVRLTGSGLGCTDWPNCEEGKLVSPLELHPMIEFGNRVFTGLVVVAVAVAVLGSIRREPRRNDLVWLSWGLVAGVVGQIVLGGITVLFDLNPALVASHFLLSLALVTDAVVLHHRASIYDSGVASGRFCSPQDTRIASALLFVALLVVMAGTVVTGTGPHGGDETAHRFQLVMTDVARVHSVLVWVLVGLTVVLAVRTRHRAVLVLLAVELAQGAIGYTQYFMGVPPLLVAFHVVGALAVWIAALRVRIALA